MEVRVKEVLAPMSRMVMSRNPMVSYRAAQASMISSFLALVSASDPLGMAASPSQNRLGPGRRAAVHQLAPLPAGGGTVVLEALLRLADAAAAGGGEGDQGLAGEVVALQEGVHDPGLHVPPDGEAHEHRVIL